MIGLTHLVEIMRDPKGRVEGAYVATDLPNVEVEFAPAADADPTIGAWEVWGVRIDGRLYSCRAFRQTDAHPTVEDGPTLDALRRAAREKRS